MKRFTIVATAAFGLSYLALASAAANPINVVAAENFYGDVVTQIGGKNVSVTSILTNPDQDPHLFEVNPSTARDLVDAKIVIVNGADYDPWMEKLLGSTKVSNRKVIIVAHLVHKKAGDNPHLWYDPATMPALAKSLTLELSATDPAHKSDYEKGLLAFIDSLKPLEAKIAEMKRKYAGLPVAASEPVFGYMAQALGLDMHNEKFQLAVMNSTEPSVSDITTFENDLKGKKVKAMFYNSQANEPTVQRLVRMAEESKVPVIGVTETAPTDTTYQAWMLSQLDVLDKALSGASM